MSQAGVADGLPGPLGATIDGDGVNFAVFSAHAEAIAVCLFDADDRETARLLLPRRTGDVFHGRIPGIGAGTRYGLRAFGPWDPARGHRFNPAKLLVDPFATVLDRPFRLHADLFDARQPKDTDTAPLVPKAIVSAPPPPSPSRPRFRWRGQVIYELHVRGFTMRHPDIPPAQRGTYAGLGHPAAVAHLQRLGVTAVELMPSAAWLDERHLPPLGLSNYWGYNPMAFLAPDPRLAPGGWAEIRAAVAALQDAGIAVLLDVVLNHSAESDHLGPTVSLRGLDNATYYRTQGEFFANDAGCGNVLALDRPPVLTLGMAALRGWAERAGLDGFRLDLATTLGRRDDGFDPAAPLLAAMQQDPVLAGRAIIAEPWDIGPGGYRLGEFPAEWGEWNDRSRDTIRRFWRGDPGMLGELATRVAGSADLFAQRHRPLSRGINYVTAHDGFTLADLVSYDTKHNRENGEQDRDGSNDNYSWNNGVEGPSGDPAIRAARGRDARAVLATLLLARGTPMLSMGDEAGRSQAGNNNAYAQDNAGSWFAWDMVDDGLIDFTARLIRLRRNHPALAAEAPLTGQPLNGSDLRDVAWRLPDGSELSPGDWQSPDGRSLMIELYDEGQRAILLLHAGQDAIQAFPPLPRSGMGWTCALDSADPGRTGPVTEPVAIAPRSVTVLLEVAGQAPRRHVAPPPGQLDRLALAAGLSPVWWDVDGGEHIVAPDTKRALLAAMRLPADTTGDVADSLARLGARATARLPPVWVAATGQPITLHLSRRTRGAWVTLQREDGGFAQLPVSADAPHVVLPPLPVGRHRVTLDDAVCQLIVAPAGCYLPPALRAGARRFGLATHLYSLRRNADQGIGDFTALADLCAEAKAVGAAVIGLNPLHALFPTDRSRASPYSPSDRRFLDPIYIDVGTAAPSAAPAADYERVWATKHQALRRSFNAGVAADPDFAAFRRLGGEALQRFAVFEAIAAEYGSTAWREWPVGLRHPQAHDIAAFAAAHAEAVDFGCWLQFVADRQLAAASGTGLALGLYRDLAVGAAPDGAEAWSRQDAMLTGVSVGAPPDPFSRQGQIWNLPPPDPLAMHDEAYAGFADLLAANMRHAGALRIDHVMALRRLFLVPEGASAREGTYLAYPFHDLLGVLALESQRARCLVVGEALGTVPEGMQDALASSDVLSYSVLWFERDAQGLRPAQAWRAAAAACASTHDLPTIAGWWTGADIAERQALGLLDDATAERTARRQEKLALLALLQQDGMLPQPIDPDGPLTDALVAAIHAFIGSTPAMLALVQADDLSGEAEAVNLPGTDRERPNWRRRHHVDVETLCRSDLAVRIFQALADRAVR